MKRADYWIKTLRLIPHPEGGFFRETYRAAETIPTSALPRRYAGRRSFSTAILFLLRSGKVSRLHRLKSDELWHFHAGSRLTIHVISPTGHYTAVRLGRDPEHGEGLQALVKAGHWFGATVDRPSSYALIGCTVAPGFDFADFELADRGMLTARYPRHRGIIARLTRAERV
jgi:uncharacterized protein